MNLRTTAAEIIESVSSDKRSLNVILPRMLEQTPAKDRALLQELSFGTCRWFFFLEKIVLEHLNSPLHRKDTMTKAVLLLGAYQLFFTRIPNHAAIHETVEAAKELKLKNTKNLVNAVLRALSRAEAPDIDAQAVRSSFPEWFSAKLDNNWPEQSMDIMQASNAYPPMFLRVNKAKYTRDAYLSVLQEYGIAATPCAYSSKGVLLEKPRDIAELPGFDQGWASVQDEAAQLSTDLLDLKPSMRVLDACAAPGGKACAILEAQSDVELIALDHDPHRLKRVEENLSRIGKHATLKACSALELDTWYDGTAFDRILIDAPCSATGVIRRHPDIKLLRDPSDLKNLAELQLQLLERLWQTLRYGGKLVYATCSIFPQENARIIERFLKATCNAKLEPIEAKWGFDTGFGHQLFPKIDGHDGFFYSVLSKDHQDTSEI